MQNFNVGNSGLNIFKASLCYGFYSHFFLQQFFDIEVCKTSKVLLNLVMAILRLLLK